MKEKLTRSNSVLLCVRFRIHRYVWSIFGTESAHVCNKEIYRNTNCYKSGTCSRNWRKIELKIKTLYKAKVWCNAGLEFMTESVELTEADIQFRFLWLVYFMVHGFQSVQRCRYGSDVVSCGPTAPWCASVACGSGRSGPPLSHICCNKQKFILISSI
jgi:hypothetical protein